MTANLRSAFSEWSPARRIVAGLAFTLAGTFTANAHIPNADSEQGKLLAPFSEFIMNMKKEGGSMSCCSLNDGRGDMEERITTAGKYQVKITHDLAGTKLPQPKWIDIPEDAILSAKHAKGVCAAVDESKSPADKKKSTCKSPPFNVIWYRDDGHVYCYFPRPQVM